MTYTNTILKNYPFGDGVAVAASTTTLSTNFIDMSGARSIWLRAGYTGDASSVYFVVYGYVDQDDDADPLITLELSSTSAADKHGKVQVPAGIPWGKVAVINNDSENAVTLATAMLLFDR